MPGLERILRGILNYRKYLRPGLLEQFETIRDDPKPQGVMFSCMDSRIVITRLLQLNVGDMFLVRNAGNIVPNHESQSYDSVTTEPGALELGCIRNNIRNVIVCGHSDCKAMNLLHEIRRDVHNHTGTPLELWLKKHGTPSVQKFEELEKKGFDKPLTFQAETSDKLFEAYIDPENKFRDCDKLSQVNTLQQLQNIASHPILTEKLTKDEVHLNALWLDIYNGDFYMFSRERKQYVLVEEEHFEHLVKDGESSGWNIRT